ncbi:succinocarboxamide synthase, chloroplastic [Seminavis robusta]|uniref:phosphoribosylaminoimidazolesuccinocarboxamide synthase n=1 Tax=Seminavis robusta TaxID=568900 RepID=A0A9N8E3X7_9STRA|nr:succinocarboxamide synthase, chloroplastic [Seminavis robusta]|eukprot:Sro477_g150820.1 succinocarboxamide synthase, chloroplastic (465) ;mRNA; r:41301-42877
MSTSSLRVVLLASSPEDAVLANAVCESLSSEFQITNVSVRSTDVPLDRLIASTRNGASTLWVVLCNDSSSLSSSWQALEELVDPVLEIPVQATTTSKAPDVSLKIAKFCGINTPNSLVQTAMTARRQARLVEDAQLHTKSPLYEHSIARCFDQNQQIGGDKIAALQDKRRVGKVRDRYEGDIRLALVTTDRQSGFDRQLARVPFKGAVLNLTSAYWFEKTTHIIPNHLVSVPHPNVSIVKKCKPFPIEFVVRSYMTGSTSTSIWKNYQDGVRNYCGHDLPDGMTKNQKLAKNLLTPTTKEEEHDRPISAADIVAEKWMTQEDFDICAKAALQVFAFGQTLAAERGLILVDTKYEFGRDLETGEILLIDEVHTPDSSRYWLASTYQQRISEGKEPDNIDKEFLRLWFRKNCDPYKDEVLPEAPRDLVCELARRYVTLYEMITWNDFEFDARGEEPIGEALLAHLT